MNEFAIYYSSEKKEYYCADCAENNANVLGLLDGVTDVAISDLKRSNEAETLFPIKCAGCGAVLADFKD